MTDYRETLRKLHNRHFALCFFLAWMITNGWAYLGVLVGMKTGYTALTAASSAYLGILWLPFTPEKIITVLIAMKLVGRLYPEDRIREENEPDV